jgi:3-oxoadipate enol-lactonase
VPVTPIGDIEIYYEVDGDGSPVLYISGTGGDLRTTPNVFDGPLARQHTVAAYDQRGLGRSTKRDEPTTMAQYGRDAAGLLDHLGWSEVGVVGVSFGGMVAQELAISRPDLVGRLELCCTSSGGEGGASYPLHELADIDDPDERARTQLAIADTRLGREWQEANPEKAAKALARSAAPPHDDDPAREVGARRQLEARQGHDTWDRLHLIAAPTLVTAGAHDGIAPVSNSENLVSRIPDASLQIFDGGHLFLVQDRSAWPAILDFLARRAGR